jgi:DNA (cytosine-5)-methyltransferase 1
LLGGKSVNGNAVLFPNENSLPYHLYWKVLNAKNFNVPQGRERVFIIGIRDDKDNNFSFSKEQITDKLLIDLLDKSVDEKYFLSKKMIDYLQQNTIKQKNNGNGFKFSPTNGHSIAKTITTREGRRMDDNFILVNNQIRRLTPRECFRLMDFPETFNWSVSDTQAYKQAGNSIVVNVLCELIKKFNL